MKYIIILYLCSYINTQPTCYSEKLVALEFEKSDKIYNLIAEIYNVLGNKELSKKLLDLSLRLITVNALKDELSGIYRKNH